MKPKTVLTGLLMGAIATAGLTAQTPNISFGIGSDGVTFNLNTYPYYYYDGMYPPPPPYHRPHRPVYGVPLTPKQYKKAVKKYMKQQEKYAKKYYKHHRKHHHHDDD